MIEITITNQGEVKIKVDNQAQSVSISNASTEKKKEGINYEPYFDNNGRVVQVNTRFADDLIKRGVIVPFPHPKHGVGPKIPDLKPDDCKKENICGHEPVTKVVWKRDKPGCKSGEIEGGPAY